MLQNLRPARSGDQPIPYILYCITELTLHHTDDADRSLKLLEKRIPISTSQFFEMTLGRIMLKEKETPSDCFPDSYCRERTLKRI